MLRRILAKYGKEICSNARRCENLLKDLCGEYRREVNVLVNAIEERVPLDLLAANRSTPIELLLTRLEKRLEEQTALTAEAARWAVESWALALNVATDAEIEAREKRAKPSPPFTNSGVVQSRDSADNQNSNVIRNDTFQPPPKPKPPARQSQVNLPPVIPQPTKMPSPLPPVYVPRNNPPAAAAPPAQNQPTNSPVIARKGFGLFRGCLLVIFLLIVSSVVLFLGVPYVIEVMRETQRERNNESPRFPVR